MMIITIIIIVIVEKGSGISSLYEGLPVVEVENLETDITTTNLKLWRNNYNNVFHNETIRYKFTMNYWLNKIKNSANNVLKLKSRINIKL